jgi:predicted AlkP superfamily pyrophosphatase or phosphodiesterase
MTTEHLVFLSIPGLRPRDIDKHNTPTLHSWANAGALAEIIPTFPCVTSCVQASMLTGTPPGVHGVIANGFYHRDRQEVEFWVGHNDVIVGEQIWDAIRRRRSGVTSAVWHAQNIKGAAADFIVTPAPIHESDGKMKLWCYSKPDGLYQQLLDAMGHFPLQHYWGPLSNIESTKWILNAAVRLTEKHRPNLHWIYIPHLDYAAQKFGPNSPQAQNALKELDQCLADFARHITALSGETVYLIAGEYALTDVAGVVYPNRLLREAGLLTIREDGGREYLDFKNSTAFALVDHQFAHVYVNSNQNPERKRGVSRVVDLFKNVVGIAAVYAGDDRARIGMNHPSSGDVILVCDDAHWLAYYWWFDDAAAPPFARTVDIHRKPGYDPVELFFDPVAKGIPLNAGLVKGSHGVPATESKHRTALICSVASKAVQPGRTYRDTDVKQISLELLGLER